MKRRLICILIWGGISLFTSMNLLITLVFTNGQSFWLVPVFGVGLPAVGLVLALLGIIPGARPAVPIFVRLIPAKCPSYVRVEAVRIRRGLFRIISHNSENLSWEFQTGETVHCSEGVLPNGERALVAIMRT